MKKVLWVLVGILVLVVDPVRADEVFKLNFETEETSYNYFQDVVSYKNGYLVINEWDDKYDDRVSFSLLDLSGEELIYREYDMYIDEYTIYNEDIYILGEARYDGSLEDGLFKLNSKLKLVDFYDLSGYDGWFDSIVNANDKGIVLVDNEEFYLIDPEFENMEFMFDLSAENDEKYIQTIKEYIPDLYKVYNVRKEIESSISNSYEISGYDVEGDKILILVRENIPKKPSHGNGQVESGEFYHANGYFLFDEKGALLSSKVYDYYDDDIFDVNLVHGYVVVAVDYPSNIPKVGLEEQEEKYGSMVEIYNSDGKLIDIKYAKNDDYGYDNIIKTEHGFSVWECDDYYYPDAPQASNQIKDKMALDRGYANGFTQVYSVVKNIKTKVLGKGKVEAVSSSLIGDEVTFKVSAEPGYVLKLVRVTDKNGNIVIFKDDTFTMPDSDVTIEAEFVPELTENPKTGVFTYIAEAYLFVAFVCCLLRIARKKRRFRRL